jgi:hypothetical protein
LSLLDGLVFVVVNEARRVVLAIATQSLAGMVSCFRFHGVTVFALRALTIVLADSLATALLALIAPTTVLTDCRPTALLASMALTTMLAYLRPTALLAHRAYTTVLAYS